MRSLPILVVVIGILAAAPASQAAAIHLTGTTGQSASELLVYRASTGERNRVQVTFLRSTTVFVDRGAKRIAADPASRCRATGRQRVVCRASDATVSLELRDGDDSATFAPHSDKREHRTADPLRLAQSYADFEDDHGEISEATWIDGGRGDDRITGSSYDDYIAPGGGADTVDARGGADWIAVAPDRAADRLRGGGGPDSLHYDAARKPVTVDLAAGSAGAGSERDSIAGFQRVHGGPHADTILGSKYADALYGEGGDDLIDGRAGSDLVTGDSPAVTQGSRNRLFGGSGNDYVDSTSQGVPPTSPIDCGPGADVVAAGRDDLLSDACESVALDDELTIPRGESPDYSRRTTAPPVARTASGDPIFEFVCPTRTGGCTGRFALESAPAPGRTDPPESYGTADFTAAAGERARVTVALTPSGRAAAESGSPVAAHVTGHVASSEGSFDHGPLDFGWQIFLPR